MTRYRKRPVEVEAAQWNPDHPDNGEVLAILSHAIGWHMVDEGICIPTLEGDMIASPGDWIILGIRNEVYPCKPDIFKATYEAVDE